MRVACYSGQSYGDRKMVSVFTNLTDLEHKQTKTKSLSQLPMRVEPLDFTDIFNRKYYRVQINEDNGDQTA